MMNSLTFCKRRACQCIHVSYDEMFVCAMGVVYYLDQHFYL